MPPPSPPAPLRYQWLELGRPEGAFFTSDSRRYWPAHKWEHVERFSVSLLGDVDAALTRGQVAHGELFAGFHWVLIPLPMPNVQCQVAHGELFAGSLCVATPGCTTADLRDTGHVPPDLTHYSAGSHVENKARWADQPGLQAADWPWMAAKPGAALG